MTKLDLKTNNMEITQNEDGSVSITWAKEAVEGFRKSAEDGIADWDYRRVWGKTLKGEDEDEENEEGIILTEEEYKDISGTVASGYLEETLDGVEYLFANLFINNVIDKKSKGE